MPLLPPLRLTGATILRDGEMRQRSVAIEGGRITKGPLPAIDLTGYLILPGIVDLHGRAFLRHLHNGPARALSATDHEAGANGVTTAWLAQGWSWEGGPHSPDAAERLLAALAAYRRRATTDLRVQLRAETHLVAEGARLLKAAGRWGVDYVVFNDHLDHGLACPAAFSEWAARMGRDADTHAQAISAAAARRAEVPRHLCTLAQAFDQTGVAYGSHGDSGGDMREHYSMIGARIAELPLTHEAAAAARAMGDPVVASAQDVLQTTSTTKIAAKDLIRAGLCDALASCDSYPALHRAAFALVDQGLRSLPAAWAMISTRPAEIMRLPDRGRLDLGQRADLVVINETTRQIEATIVGGRVSWLSGSAGMRLRPALGDGPVLAAE